MNDTPRTEAAARRIDGFADEWVPRYVSEELERELHEAHAYADRLVAHKDMVCLPADLKNLREANAHFAAENALLKNAIANDRDVAAAEAEEFAKFRAYKENQGAQYTGTNAGLNIGLYLANQDIIELTAQRDSYKERYTKLAGKYAVEIHELTEQRDEAVNNYETAQLLSIRVGEQRDRLAVALERLEKTAGGRTWWDDPARVQARECLQSLTPKP